MRGVSGLCLRRKMKRNKKDGIKERGKIERRALLSKNRTANQAEVKMSAAAVGTWRKWAEGKRVKKRERERGVRENRDKETKNREGEVTE